MTTQPKNNNFNYLITNVISLFGLSCSRNNLGNKRDSFSHYYIPNVEKNINLLNVSDNENSKFATKKWYVIHNEANGNYSEDEEITFLTKSIESSLCDYSDAYILVTGNITATPNNAATQVVFKNCAPFKDCRTEINDTFVDYADFINITMPM